MGRIPAYPQRPGDPQRGYDALLNRAALTCGLPYSSYAKAVAKSARGPASNPGPQFPGRTGRNLELPYLLTAHQAANGVELVTTNCLACHAATIDGRLIMGLGNAFLDMTQDPVVAIEAVGAPIAGKAERAQWRRWADRIAVLSGDLLTDTVGVNTADHLTLALMARHDPKTLAWSAKPQLEPPPLRLPTAIPPWWNLRKKHALFYSGEGRGEQSRYLLLAAATCIDSVAEARALDPWFVDLRSYLASLAPPKYPYAIDQALAQRGDAIFQSNCKSCHGTYGEDWRYPNLVVAVGEVGTDPELARAAYSDVDRFRTWFQQSYYGELSRLTPALGYVAPPLDGVWATAPYLHNDAVPTLAALLNSPARPAYWRLRHTADGAPVYDREAVGWAYDILPQGKSAAMSWDERDRIVDSTGKGYGNGGHTFGNTLSADARRALIEYLKTL